jgi:membrane protease YdiL (CAAX protease family)
MIPAPAADRPPAALRLARDTRDAAGGALRNPWFIGCALLFLLTAGGLALLTGGLVEWLGYYLGFVVLGSLGLAIFVYSGTRDPAAKAQDAAGRGPVRHPAAETALVLACIGAFVLVRVDQLLHGPFTTALFALLPDPWWREHDTAIILVKLALNVVLPLLAFRALGYRRRELGLRWGAGWRLWPVFLLIAAPKLWGALLDPAGLLPALGNLILLTIFYFFAAGLPEELTSRVLLQTRLEAWWGSPSAALFVQAAVFALVHVPIRLISGADLLSITGNLLLFVLALGLFFGFIYQRTHALLPVAWIHALVDA